MKGRLFSLCFSGLVLLSLLCPRTFSTKPRGCKLSLHCWILEILCGVLRVFIPSGAISLTIESNFRAQYPIAAEFSFRRARRFPRIFFLENDFYSSDLDINEVSISISLTQSFIQMWRVNNEWIEEMARWDQSTWQRKYNEIWVNLFPSSGAAGIELWEVGLICARCMPP